MKKWVFREKKKLLILKKNKKYMFFVNSHEVQDAGDDLLRPEGYEVVGWITLSLTMDFILVL